MSQDRASSASATSVMPVATAPSSGYDETNQLRGPLPARQRLAVWRRPATCRRRPWRPGRRGPGRRRTVRPRAIRRHAATDSGPGRRRRCRIWYSAGMPCWRHSPQGGPLRQRARSRQDPARGPIRKLSRAHRDVTRRCGAARSSGPCGPGQVAEAEVEQAVREHPGPLSGITERVGWAWIRRCGRRPPSRAGRQSRHPATTRAVVSHGRQAAVPAPGATPPRSACAGRPVALLPAAPCRSAPADQARHVPADVDEEPRRAAPVSRRRRWRSPAARTQRDLGQLDQHAPWPGGRTGAHGRASALLRPGRSLTSRARNVSAR